MLDPRCGDYCLTEEERLRFETDGFFIVEDVLPDTMVDQLAQVADRVDQEHRDERGLGPYDRVNVLDFIGKDEGFLTLLDWYKTFPKVFGILGWHIQLYHTHLVVTPPSEEGLTLEHDGLGVGFHQDTGRLNLDFETHPRPRVSIKVAYFLSDTSEEGRGNFYVVPGSHLADDFPGEDRKSVPEEAVPVLAPKGSAVFFDRRLWHSATKNYWDEPRRVLFYGYSYRWLRPRDEVSVDHYLDRCNPIQKQLLGASKSAFTYTSPKDDDVPLRDWIRENLGEEAVVA